MALSRKLAVAGGAALCVLGLFLAHQHGDAAPGPQATTFALNTSRFAAPAQPKTTPLADPVPVVSAPLDRFEPPPASRAARLPPVPAPDRVATVSQGAATGAACDVGATSKVLPMAIVRLSIDAPCQGGQDVMVHHNGLMITDVMDRDGQLTLDVPALSDNAVFMVDFPDGTGTVALANVPLIHGLDRFALQWTGHGAFRIHARDDRPDHDGTQYLWSVSARPGDAVTAGFVTRLGDPFAADVHMAEIYTRPAVPGRMSPPELIVEAEVTSGNCGREVVAQSIEWRRGQSLRSRDLVLSMPNCSAVGDFLVLNNLANDLMIASR